MVTDLWKPKTINLIVPRGWRSNSIGYGGINSVARVGDFFAEDFGCEFQGVICCDVRAGSPFTPYG